MQHMIRELEMRVWHTASIVVETIGYPNTDRNIMAKEFIYVPSCSKKNRPQQQPKGDGLDLMSHGAHMLYTLDLMQTLETEVVIMVTVKQMNPPAQWTGRTGS